MRLAQLLPANVICSYMGGKGLQHQEAVVQLYQSLSVENVGRRRLVQGSRLSVLHGITAIFCLVLEPFNVF